MKNDFEADVENVLACPNNEKLSSPLRNLRVYRYNRTQLSVNYDFNYHRPLDEKVGGAVIVERWGDGGWIKIPFVGYQRNICDRMLKNFRQLWIDIYSKAGVKDPSKCPIPAMKNDFEADVENILACPNNEKLSSPLRNLRVNRYNRTVLLVNYDFTFHRPLDEKVGGAIIVERWGDGGWIKIPFLGFQRNICDTMVKKFGKLWTDFYSKAGVKDPSKCPIPPGNYSVRNFAFQTIKMPIPFWSGRFRFTTMFQDVDTKEDIYCIMCIITITEKY